MAQFEQKINGKIVKSNLELESVDGALVKFTNGSWCNADTGKVVLVGDGYIHISGDPDSPKAERKTTEMTFDARPLKITGLYAEIEVVPHTGNSIVVTIEGVEEDTKTIEAKELGAYLVLSGGQPGGIGDVGGNIGISYTRTIKNTGIGNVISSILGVDNSTLLIQNIVSGSLGNLGPKVTVKVPVGTAISASELHGEVTIGNIFGDITLTLDSSYDVTIGNTKDCKVVIEGSGALEIGHIDGNFDITVNGSGDTEVSKVTGTLVADMNGRGGIEVSAGDASTFYARNKASGEFVYNGKAHNARLVLGGMGGIEILETIGDLIIDSDGSGDIEISMISGGKIGAKLKGRGGISIEGGNATLMHIASDGSGEFEFDGTAQDSTLVLNGRGGIEITTINGDLDITTTGSGDIEVEDGQVGKLKVDLSGRGGFSFDGHAVDANLKSTGSGDIDVTYVKNKPSIIQRGRGDITVDNWDD